MSETHVQRAQERVEYYGKFLAKHDESMLAQISKLLDVDRIRHTKTKTTDRLLWGHIPHTKHPNATDHNATVYWGYVDASESAKLESDLESNFFDQMESNNDEDDDDSGDSVNRNDIEVANATVNSTKPRKRRR